MSVIMSLEFDDLILSRKAPCQADRAHTGLGPAADHPHQVHTRHHAADQLRHFYLQFGRRAKRGGKGGILLYGLHDGSPAISKDHRPPSASISDKSVVVRIVQLWYFRP